MQAQSAIDRGYLDTDSKAPREQTNDYNQGHVYSYYTLPDEVNVNSSIVAMRYMV